VPQVGRRVGLRVTLSDFLVPTLSIECEPCGRRGRYNVARLMEQYGDAKLPELRISSRIARRRARRASMTAARFATAPIAARARRDLERVIALTS
jgi:hypothetical protein